MSLYDYLINTRKEKGCGLLPLLDPDHQGVEGLVRQAAQLANNGADGVLIGGSLLLSNYFDELVKAVKEAVHIPVILFPGNIRQLSEFADGVLFLSLISGRNPAYLIGEHVLAAPIIRSLKLEPISTGYMLIESGKTTSVEFMSGTKPIPRDKPNIAVAHGLAGEYLGMKLLYLEGGSGAENSVPEEMVQMVSQTVTIPVIVGGGIRTPELARQKVEAGASFVVISSAFEKGYDAALIKGFAEAIHIKSV